MRTATKTYKVYTFDELDQKGRDKAIDNEIQYWIEMSNCESQDVPDEIKHAGEQAEKMQTPWFFSSYIWEYAKDFILENCKNYEYLSSGEIFIPEGAY